MSNIINRLVVIVLILIILLVTGNYISGSNLNKIKQEASISMLTPKESELILPDLVAIPPRELFIENSPNIRNIRFNTTFANIGEGALEIKGEHDEERLTTYANQIIKRVDNTTTEEKIGEFVFHPTHNHWHMENYIEFELVNITSDGKPDKVVATTDKMSFCIWDEDPFDLDLNSASPERVYIGCNGEKQGISVGWSDTYNATVEGQELDIRGLTDGQYLVRLHINPDRNILESNYDNNAAEVFIEITGNTIVIKEDQD